MFGFFKKKKELNEDAVALFARLNADEASSAELDELISWAEKEPEKLDDLELLAEVWDETGTVQPDRSIFFEEETVAASDNTGWFDFDWSAWRYPAAVAAMLMVAVIGVVNLNMSTAPVEPVSYATVRGDTQELQLADGSDVFMNGLSRLEVNYSEEERRITLLEGEAYFKVAHNKERAFIVTVAGAEVQAIGTAFDIEKSSEGTLVTVTEGTVAITMGDTSERYTAGTKILISADSLNGAEFTATNFIMPDFEDAVTWRRGVLNFAGEPLSLVVERINRQSGKRIAIADPAIAELKIFGSFRQNNVKSFIDAIEELYPIRVRESHYRIALYDRSGNNAPQRDKNDKI